MGNDCVLSESCSRAKIHFTYFSVSSEIQCTHYVVAYCRNAFHPSIQYSTALSTSFGEFLEF